MEHNTNLPGTIYTCPMHPEVIKKEPGKCPGCGMDLIPKKRDGYKDPGMQSMSRMDHESAMTNPAMAKQMEADMRRRFWISFLLSIPIFLYSPVGVNIFKVHFPSPVPINWLLLILTTPIVFWAGSIFITGTYYSLKAKKLNMAVLIATGVLAAYVFSVLLTIIGSQETFYEAAALLVTFVLFGHWMEMRSRKGTSDALRALFDLVPPKATVMRDGAEIEIPSEQIVKGDVVIIKPGDKVPVDGEVVEGESTVDESLVTGESIPVSKTVGDQVVGGAVNITGWLKFKATKIGADTVLAQIIKMVETAQNSKAPGQRIADKWAGRLVILALGSGVLTFLVWYFPAHAGLLTALTFAISAVVIACPDALGLATPTVVAVGTGIGAKHNILIKDAATLENTSRLTAIVLDKTGTLTEGKPIVTDVLGFNGFSPEEILIYQASIAKGSNHPISKAIVDEADNKKVTLKQSSSFGSIAGFGLKGKIDGKEVLSGKEKLLTDNGVATASEREAIDRLASQGKTLSLISIAGKLAGIIAVADTIKPSSKQAIKALKELGLEVAMITGDHPRVAEAVARDLEIDRVFAEVLPQDKAKYVKQLQDEGKFVAMVGDGINDAPALAQADIGIAIGAGTDVAIEAGNIVLMKSDPYDIVAAIRLSKATVAKMKQNLFWAAIYNVLAIPVAAGAFYKSFGILLRPEIAALLMSASSIIVATNAIMLKRVESQLENGKPPQKKYARAVGAVLILVLLTASLFNFHLTFQRKAWVNRLLGLLPNYDEGQLANVIIPPGGAVLPVAWGDLGMQMTATGVIDAAAFKALYQERGGLNKEELSLLADAGNGQINIAPENAPTILNLFWALGLGNNSPVLDAGEIQNPLYGGAASFAATGGWTLASGDPMQHYSKHQFISLTAKQQALVDQMSKNIYRPCCNNAAHFPDCNHGMAMLGFLELAASQGLQEKAIYQGALALNSAWFPDVYTALAGFSKSEKLRLSPKAALAAEYSSAQGSEKIQVQLAPPAQQTSGCNV